MNKRIKRILVLVLVIILSFFLLIPSIHISKEQKRGNISKETYVAPFDFMVIDREKTDQMTKEEQLKVCKVYSLDFETSLKLLEDVSKTFSKIEDIRENNKTHQGKKEEKIKRLLPDILPEDIRLIASCDKNTFSEIEETTKNIMNICLEKGILEEGLPDEKIEVIKSKREGGSITSVANLLTSKKIKSSNLEQLALIQRKPTRTDELAWGIASFYIAPNLYFDKNITKKRKKYATQEPIEVFVKKGDIIVSEGEVIDALSYEKLKTIAQMKKGIDKQTFSSFLAIFLSFLAFIIAFILKYQRELKIERILAISLISLLTIGIAKCFAIWMDRFWMCLPFANISILIALFSEGLVSIFFTFILGILISQFFGLDFSNLVFFLIPSLFSIFFLQIVRKRADLFKVCLGIAIFNIILSLFLFQEPLRYKLSFSILNAFLVYLITFGLLYVFELFFSTNFKFLELSDLNIPLLRDLFLEAPGTYHHSLIVGTMAEDAALSIDANAYLARAGSYYHDIGKMINPEYFIENQKERKVSPSFPILKSHIERGVSIAKIKHLPSEIVNIILSHHGTEKIGEEAYPGPKPQTKEEAIIMLADAVEEKIRSYEKPSLDVINRIIKDTIAEKLIIGELSSSCLTILDIKKIEESFINILVSLFHAKDETKTLS